MVKMEKGLRTLAETDVILNTIREKAFDDDHLLVTYRKNRLEMAHAVIAKLEAKLSQIVDLAQDALGD